ncbi:MAG: efflux RND transporter periplasmic adaptor subunit [Thermoanaerobaculales bacterium]|jgi:RND family efflux transporter MFP subunit|nr:efflux RND transporter periplasmic adaptor subunit [Thermoanaerobaculales bacterium]
MTETTKKRFRILSLVALVAIAAGGVIWVRAQSADGAGKTDAASADQASEQAADGDASAEAESKAKGEDDVKDEDEVLPVPVEVAEVTTGVIASYITATANLVAEGQVKVLAEAEGRVQRLEVEEGDLVRQGQVLAVLDQDEARIAKSKVELKSTNAEAALERARNSYEQGLISSEAFDKLEMDAAVARQELAEAEWRLAKTVIRAPFAARVTERFVNLGQHLRPGDELFTVADYDPLIARIYLPESDVVELAEGREVRITPAAEPGLAFAGRIRQIAPVVDTATGTVKVTVEAVSPPEGVRPGAFVSVGIVRERHEGAVLLPRESVIRELRTAHVFVADDGAAVKRAVTLGLEEGELVEVLDGVSAGDAVVIAGQGGLDDGQKIKIL